jgi:hypothetical protein
MPERTFDMMSVSPYSARPFTRASMRFAFAGSTGDLGRRMVTLSEWLLEDGLTAVPAWHEFDWDIPAP